MFQEENGRTVLDKICDLIQCGSMIDMLTLIRSKLTKLERE